MLKKCPRCNLNYLRPGETLCDICSRELGKTKTKDETIMICPECNENPVVSGEELCITCLRERMRQEYTDIMDDDTDVDAVISVDDETKIDVSKIEEIPIDDIDDEMPESELVEIDAEFGIDEEADEEESEDDLLY